MGSASPPPPPPTGVVVTVVGAGFTDARGRRRAIDGETANFFVGTVTDDSVVIEVEIVAAGKPCVDSLWIKTNELTLCEITYASAQEWKAYLERSASGIAVKIY